MRKIKTEFILSPFFVFPFGFLLFVGISPYQLSFLGTVTIAIGIISFMTGFKLSKMRFKKSFDEHAGGLSLALFTIGTIALILNIERAGGIPLLQPFAKRSLNVTYTMLASLIPPAGILAIATIGKCMQAGKISGAQARSYAFLIMGLTTFLSSLLGYKTQTFVSLIGCFFSMYFSGIIGIEIIVLSAFFFFCFLGSDISKRAGVTLSVYDSLVDLSWPFGINRGSVAISTFSSYLHFVPGPRIGPRTIVARMFGVQDVSMTSTLFGTAMLDFGVVGIFALGFCLGLIIGAAFHATKLTRGALPVATVSLLTAYLLVGIETGLVDFNVFVFFLAGFILLLALRKF